MTQGTKPVSSRTRLAAHAIVLLVLFAASHTAVAQTAGPLPPPQPSRNQPSPPPQDKPQIRVSVAVVSTPVVVHDSKGALTFDLGKEDFRIYDNGLEQPLVDFDMGGAPLSVAFVVEDSSRIEPLLPAMRRTGILFTQTVLGENAEAAVIGYHDSVTKLLDFTANSDAIEKTFTDLKAGTSGARLYDGLSQAVHLLRDRPPVRRRVIVALAEASDTGSDEKLGDVLREAQLANITIYSVALSSTAANIRGQQRAAPQTSVTPSGTFGQTPIPGTVQTPSTEAAARNGSADILGAVVWAIQHATEPLRQNALEMTAAGTGGLNQAVVRDRSIEDAIDQIGAELHAQYTLSYRPSGTESGYHEIKVVVDRPGAQVRTRPGYYLGTSVR
jgi:VWFA-related protein